MSAHNILTFLFFATAVSFDGLAAGVGYGMRQIHIAIVPLLLINLVSALAVALSMSMGGWLGQWLNQNMAHTIGGIIFIALGLHLLWQAWQPMASGQGNRDQEKQTANPRAWHLHVGHVNLIIQIYRDPAYADLDRSGFLSSGEAMLLGIALALDALAAGVAASFAGYSKLWTPLAVGVMQTIFIAGGVGLGRQLNDGGRYAYLNRISTIFPGAVLVLLGLLRLPL
jgi:putative sporulation protein YtaF